MRKFLSITLFVVLLAGLVAGALYCLQNGLKVFAFILFGIAAVLLIYVISIYNKMVKYRNKVKQALSLIDVQLKLRFDLTGHYLSTSSQFTVHPSKSSDDGVY